VPGPAWIERCTGCGRAWSLAQRRWRCDCGGLLDLQGPAGDTPAWAEWREEPTPLREVRAGLWLKMEQVLPTGSFKARGASAMLGLAADLGERSVVVDSSGNAGRAVAAYAARAGLQATVFVPDSTGRQKVEAITSLGATVIEVPGGRQAAARAAIGSLDRGGPSSVGAPWYASHAFQPAFHLGVRVLAFELDEQLGDALGTVVVPAGNGTLVIGLWLGFRDLLETGRRSRMPAIVAVQSERCAPLAGLGPAGSTAAVGIAIPTPPRAGQVAAAVRTSGGLVLLAAEDDLLPAQGRLRAMGVDVETTAAAVWAAWHRDGGPTDSAGPVRGDVVLVLTGGQSPASEP
jgi:threonine synthase